jgi:hypothetical protein
MQVEVTVLRLIIVPLKWWKSSNIWKKPLQMEFLCRKELKAV